VKLCHQCGGKFGLVRYYNLRRPFCSRRCVDRFKKSLAQRLGDESYMAGYGVRHDRLRRAGNSLSPVIGWVMRRTFKAIHQI
jgi:hypothetical protein